MHFESKSRRKINFEKVRVRTRKKIRVRVQHFLEYDSESGKIIRIHRVRIRLRVHITGIYNFFCININILGFNAPSKIQETALPTLLADPPQNMIAQSQSGTGKTAAFVLSMLSRVDTSKPYPQVTDDLRFLNLLLYYINH